MGTNGNVTTLNTTPPQFNENSIELMRKLRKDIEGVDVLMTVGADVMFMNQWTKIEDILQPDDKVVVARERTTWWPINNDVMIWVNTPDTLALMDRFIADYPLWKEYCWRQQQHLWNMIQMDPWVRSTVRIVEAQVMNQHPDNWQLGEYIIHFYGMEIEKKVNHARSLSLLFPNYLPVYGGVNASPTPDVL